MSRGYNIFISNKVVSNNDISYFCFRIKFACTWKISLLHLVLQHREITLLIEKRDGTFVVELPPWCKYSIDFSSSLG